MIYTYKGNWTAKNREALIRRIEIKQKEIDLDIIIIKRKGLCHKRKWTKQSFEDLD